MHSIWDPHPLCVAGPHGLLGADVELRDDSAADEADVESVVVSHEADGARTNKRVVRLSMILSLTDGIRRAIVTSEENGTGPRLITAVWGPTF